MISANRDHPVRLDAGENPHQEPVVNPGDHSAEAKVSSEDQSSVNKSLETKAGDRTKVVALMIGFLVLLVLLVIFNRRGPSEESIQHLKDELKQKDELIRILAEGHLSQKEEAQSSKKKRPFLVRFLHVLDRVVVWAMIIILISFGITYWICANACTDQRRSEENMTPLDIVLAPVYLVLQIVWIPAVAITFAVWAAWERIKKWLGKED